MEIWKGVLNYESIYQVSNLGNLRSLDKYVINNIHGGNRFMKGKVISQKTKSNGYKEVSLHNGSGSSRSMYVHRLVCQAFYGNIEIGLIVNHLDGDKSNNKLDNLEICSYSQNSKHSYHILNNKIKIFKGEDHNNSKVSNDDVLFIRKNYIKGNGNSELYNIFKDKISISSFRKICYNATWKHLI